MKRDNIRLKSIEIRGFMSIPYDHPLTLDLGNINILLGANGAGKSNIIAFFKMLGYMMKGSFQRYVALMGSSQKFLYFGSKKTSTIKASLKFTKGSDYEIYNFSLTFAMPNRLIITSEEIEYYQKDNPGPITKMLNSNYEESALIKETGKIEKLIHNLLSSCKIYQFSDSSLTSSMRQASTVDNTHYLLSDAGNLASFLYYLRNNYPHSYNRIKKYVRSVVPQFEDFYLLPENGYISLKWTDKNHIDYVFTSDQFSDGSIRFIALATLLLQPSETIPFVIFIDEPEVGLHPFAIHQLNVMIRDASIHAQIVIVTQSPALIDDFNVDDVIVIERNEVIDGTISTKLSEKEYSDWLSIYNLSELWNKNVIGGQP